MSCSSSAAGVRWARSCRGRAAPGVQEGVFVLAYDAFPVCGDGVDFAVDFHPVHGKSRSLLKVPPPPPAGRPTRLPCQALCGSVSALEYRAPPRGRGAHA